LTAIDRNAAALSAHEVVVAMDEEQAPGGPASDAALLLHS
jgi:hypothetical protein